MSKVLDRILDKIIIEPGIFSRISLAILWIFYPPIMKGCTGCKFFTSKEEAIKGEPFPGFFNRDLKYSGFCEYPYNDDIQTDCAWVNYGCLFKQTDKEV